MDQQSSDSTAQPSVVLVIPTRNESENLKWVIAELEKQPVQYKILLVDGHSTDGTVELARQHGMEVIQDGGKGKGDGLRCAINHVQDDIMVFMDADGSHDPAHIPAMVQPIIDGDYDLVVGSRYRGGSDELMGDLNKFLRMTGSSIITLTINYRFNVRLTDSQNGFRAIRTSAAKTLNLKEDIFTIETEMLYNCLHRGYRVSEVAAHENVRMHGDSGIRLRVVWWRYVYVWIKGIFFK